jgi:hypothetical protein
MVVKYNFWCKECGKKLRNGASPYCLDCWYARRSYKSDPATARRWRDYWNTLKKESRKA